MKATATAIGAILMMTSVVVIVTCVLLEVFSVYPFIAFCIGFALLYWGTSNPEKFFPNEQEPNQNW